MHSGTNHQGDNAPAARALNPGRPADLIPLYDTHQFSGLIERERARADRAAVRAPDTLHRRAAKPTVETPSAAAGKSAKAQGQPKPSSDGVWGATTHNREFSLVVFRPRSRNDRGGLVDLLVGTVRTTDAVGIIDARRLGVLLPDTAAENAVLFVKKILAAAEEIGVHLSHVVHTYPAAWPDDAGPEWHDPDSAQDDRNDRNHGHGASGSATPHHRRLRAQPETTLVKVLVNWLQSVADRRMARRAERATA